MQRFRLVLEAGLIHTCLWVGAGAAALLMVTQHVFHLSAWQPYLLCFAGVVFIYNLDHLLDARTDNVSDPDLAALLRGPFRWCLMGLMLLCALVAIAFLFLFESVRGSVLLYLAAGAGIVYSLPLVPRSKTRNPRWLRLKNIPGFKAVLIASAVSTAAVALPLSYADAFEETDPGELGQLFLFLFVFTGSNALLFDLRDVTADRSAGSSTLPVLIGPGRTRQWIVIVNLLGASALVLFWVTGSGTPHPEWIVVTGLTVLAAIVMGEDMPRARFAFLVDGALWLPGLLGLLHGTV